jgi:hypothetical protein
MWRRRKKETTMDVESERTGEKHGRIGGGMQLIRVSLRPTSSLSYSISTLLGHRDWEGQGQC